MTIKELLELESKISSVSEFFSLLYDQSIDSSFSVFSNLCINYNSLEGVSVSLIEFEGQNYFKYMFCDECVLWDMIVGGSIVTGKQIGRAHV